MREAMPAVTKQGTENGAEGKEKPKQIPKKEKAMRRLIPLLIVAILFTALAATANAQGSPPITQANTAEWQVRYYNNTTLTGSPVVTRVEPDPNYVNVLTNFAPGVTPDNFSARFERYVDVTAGTYRLSVTADDGVRVYVDGNPVIDQWKDQGPTTYTKDISLTTGAHLVTVDYYDKAQFATLQFRWSAVATTAQPTPTATRTVVPAGWKGEFFNNTSLTGTPLYTDTYSEINFDWGTGAPAPRFPTDNFSGRFTRTLNLEPGTWRFTATFDDGARLYINNRLLINRWTEGAIRSYYYEMYLPGGPTEVRFEFFELTERAVARLTYQNVSAPIPAATPTIIRPTSTPTPVAVPGEVIVDDNSSSFIKGGPPSGFRTETQGYNGQLTWTQNNEVQRNDYNFGRWYPTLTARNYEVFAYIPDQFTTTTYARYSISHRDGIATVVINQSQFSNEWVSLGTHPFTGTPGDYVGLSDVTSEPALSTLLAFDAMRFVPR
jgi:hypothetical protein